MIAELHIKIHVVSHEAKEEAEAAPPTDSRLTHVHEYFTGTRASTIKNGITKEP